MGPTLRSRTADQESAPRPFDPDQKPTHSGPAGKIACAPACTARAAVPSRAGRLSNLALQEGKDDRSVPPKPEAEGSASCSRRAIAHSAADARKRLFCGAKHLRGRSKSETLRYA